MSDFISARARRALLAAFCVSTASLALGGCVYAPPPGEYGYAPGYYAPAYGGVYVGGGYGYGGGWGHRGWH